MKQLLKYYSKKRLFVVGVITAICLILSTVILLESNFVRTSSFWVEKPYMPDYGYHIQATVADDAPLGIVAVFASILVVLVPIFEFYFKMRKKSHKEQITQKERRRNESAPPKGINLW